MNIFLLFLLASGLFASEVNPAYVKGTELFVKSKSGKLVTGQKLVGAIIVAHDEEGSEAQFKIDKIELDKKDPAKDVYLYTFSVQDENGKWVSYCTPDPKGLAAGFPLQGSWNKLGQHLKDDEFIISCTSGAIGKCVRFGYKPWKNWEMHQACVRLLRADYCGDGISHTEDGTAIEVIDRDKNPPDKITKLKFEAGWGPEGATCLSKTRIKHADFDINSIRKRCRPKLDNLKCTLESEMKNPKALLFNRSAD